MQNLNRYNYKSITAIGSLLIVSNVSIALLILFFPRWNSNNVLSGIVYIFSFLGVFPVDLALRYPHLLFGTHYFWIVLLIICAAGILLYNNLARITFIAVQIFHIGILIAIVIMHFRHANLIDYLFISYFNLVVFGVYVGVLTLPAVVEQFSMRSYPISFDLIISRNRPLKRTLQDAEGFYNLGLTYSLQKRYWEAIKALKESLRIKSGDDKVHFNIGLNYFKIGSLQEATRAFKEAASLNPKNPAILFNLGLAYIRQGCYKEAIEVLYKAHGLDADNADIAKNLGISYFQTGSFENAINAFKKALQLRPNDPEAQYQLGILYASKDNCQKEAMETLQKLIRQFPDNLEAKFNLGLVTIKLKRHKDAIRLLKEVIQKSPQHAQAHYHLGITYALIEDYHSAKREFNILKTLDTDLASSLSMVIK